MSEPVFLKKYGTKSADLESLQIGTRVFQGSPGNRKLRRVVFVDGVKTPVSEEEYQRIRSSRRRTARKSDFFFSGMYS